VDINNNVNESDENNTFIIGSIKINDRLADLVPVSLELSGGDTWAVGSDLYFSITEKNAGSGIALKHSNQLCLIDQFNNLIPVSDAIVNFTYPGQSITSHVNNIKIPDIFDGQYSAAISIDAYDEVGECDEKNLLQIPDSKITVSGARPKLIFPENEQTDNSSSIHFEWTAFRNPDAVYILQISEDKEFTKIIKNITGIYSADLIVAGLEIQKIFFWRVAAKPLFGDLTPWSDVWKFSTYQQSVPDAPILKYPPENSKYIPLIVTLNWNSVLKADRYHLQVSSDSSFSKLLLNDSSLSAPQKTTEPLLFASKYFWRVRAAAQGGLYSKFSETWNFMTKIKPVASPDNLKASIFDKKIVLNWTDNSDNENLFSIYRKDGDSLSTLVFKKIGQTKKDSTQFIDKEILSGCTYTYKVDASSSDTSSAFTNLAEVKVPTSVLDEKMPLNFEVHQNYPNPFNSSTSITYELPWETNVRLTVYDLLGREIAQLVNEKQSSGKYTLRLDAKDLPSGSYFYLLQTKDKSITKKFTILK
ncbi:MAG: T9SS type A sorting domain-containing protein, partial [Clostridiales bacterium]